MPLTGSVTVPCQRPLPGSSAAHRGGRAGLPGRGPRQGWLHCRGREGPGMSREKWSVRHGQPPCASVPQEEADTSILTGKDVQAVFHEQERKKRVTILVLTPEAGPGAQASSFLGVLPGMSHSRSHGHRRLSQARHGDPTRCIRRVTLGGREKDRVREKETATGRARDRKHGLCSPRGTAPCRPPWKWGVCSAYPWETHSSPRAPTGRGKAPPRARFTDGAAEVPTR